MIVRIDGYKHVSKKETGEVRTIIYCSVPAVSDRSEFGFIPVSAVWLNDCVSYDCGKFYEAVLICGMVSFKTKLLVSILFRSRNRNIFILRKDFKLWVRVLL